MLDLAGAECWIWPRLFGAGTAENYWYLAGSESSVFGRGSFLDLAGAELDLAAAESSGAAGAESAGSGGWI